MNKTASAMKIEIRMIAGYRALTVSKYYLFIILGSMTLFLAQRNLAVSPLYILLFLAVLPKVLSTALKDYSKKIDHKLLKAVTEDPEFILKQLKNKYKYSKLRYFSDSASYLLAVFLLCLWQINYSRSMQRYPILLYAPLAILASSLLVRFLGVIYYRIKLPYDLRYNKL